MSEIPEMRCPECGALMRYGGGPSDTNIFIMICTRGGCHRQETYYLETRREKESSMVIHILDSGLPLCGFSRESPAFWPEGHKWVDVEDKGRATCPGCKTRVGPEEDVERSEGLVDSRT
ncbi:MAG: hypothetical protein CEN90_641 [Parcubacteria group bacterium Licking1014_17]|nr:MAG: hypothetical protein CEN90_641 [Parcubacteria group bacterium Licking1014_17]